MDKKTNNSCFSVKQELFVNVLKIILYLHLFYGFINDKAIAESRKKQDKFSIFKVKTEKNENSEKILY